MKKFIFGCIALILIICASFIIYLNQAINNNDIFYYKSARFCSDLVQSVMKSPSSYSYQKLSVTYKIEPKEVLWEQIKDKSDLKDYFDRGEIELIKYFTLVYYNSKNASRAELKGTASCDFSVLKMPDDDFFIPKIDSININGKKYKDDNLFDNFNNVWNTLEIPKTEIKDRIDYFLNKDKFSIRNSK